MADESGNSKAHYDYEVSRGRQAELLLENPLLVESFEKLEQEIMQQWKNAPARDQEGREKLWTMLKLLERVRANIQSIATTGKLAQASLSEMERQTRIQRAWHELKK